MYVCVCVYRERNVRCRVGILCGDCDGDGNRSAVKPRNERERQWWCLCVTDGTNANPRGRVRLDWENKK